MELEEDEGVSGVFVAVWCSNAVPPGRTCGLIVLNASYPALLDGQLGEN